MKTFFTISLLFAMFCIKPLAVRAQVWCNVTDSLALVDLYNSTNGPGWVNQANWLYTLPVSTWYGVSLVGTSVTNISLRNNNLNGGIPSSLGNLSSLQVLNLSQNQLNGGVPASLGNLTNLQTLSLGYNQLSGSIPLELSYLSNLQKLELDDNILSGNIPPELGSFNNMQRLDLGHNKLTGVIPPELGNLSSLQYLFLRFNQLTGSIPTTLGKLINLITLFLDVNQLSGSIPVELGKLSNVNYLWLQYNQLSGSIPVELGSLSNLKWLALEVNNLSGSIPSSLGNLSNLEALELGQNQISGSIPSSLGSLYSLVLLDVGYNELSGSIPSSLAGLSNLGEYSSVIGIDGGLYLNNNHLRGNISSSLGNLTKLVNYFLIDSNYFDFNGMELVAQKYSFAIYSPQDTVLPIQFNQTQNKLYVSAGGTLSNNTYTWYRENQADTTITGDSTLTPTKGGRYAVSVTNSIATQLTLLSDTFSVLSVYAIDPSSKAFALVNTDGSIKQDISGINFTSIVSGTSGGIVSGAVTDGVTKLLLLAKSNVPLTFTIGSPKAGTLSGLLAQTNRVNSITAQPVNGIVAVIYTSPDGYGASNPKGGRSIAITATDPNNDSANVSLTLVTPPVVLVHGMWSDSTQWVTDGFKQYLLQNGIPNVYLADYKQSNAQTFDPLNPESQPARDAIYKQVMQARLDKSAQGIADAQVDMVGHSLGGLHSRSFSQDVRFLDSGNYYKGYFHKLITIGTPHFGSEEGPILYYGNAFLAGLAILNGNGIEYAIISRIISAVSGKKIGSCHRDFNPAFKNTHAGLDNLTATSLFKVHAVEARWDTPGTNSIPGTWWKFLLIMGKYTTNTLLDLILRDTSSDIIVPRYSQIGGLPNSNFSHFDNTAHSALFFIPKDPSETANPLIQQRVGELLLSDNPLLFANGFPAPYSIKTPFGAANPGWPHGQPGFTNHIDSNANYVLKIIAPTSKDLFKNNGADSLTLRLTFTDSTKLAHAIFMVENIGWVSVPDQAPFVAKIAIPKTIPIGRLTAIQQIIKTPDSIAFQHNVEKYFSG